MSSPKNLEEITPKEMSFNITSSNKNEKMYEGMIITYKVTPLLNIPLSWMTEITHVKEKKFLLTNKDLVLTKCGIINIYLKSVNKG